MAVRTRKLLVEPPLKGCNCQVEPNCTPLCRKACHEYCNAPEQIYPLLPPPPPPAVLHTSHHKFKLPVPLTVSIVILATAFLFFTCYTAYRFYSYWHCSRRRRSDRRQPDGDDGPQEFLDEDHGPIVDHPIWYIRTVGLDPSVIEAITIVRYKRGEGLIEGTDCSVCLSEFQEDETLRLLPKCNHAFHIPCIDTWLRSHTNCPMCRARIVVNNTLPFPLQESTIVQNSAPAQETLISASDSNGEITGEAEAEASGGESMAEIGVKSNEDDQLAGALQPVRRSVSVDSLSASIVSSAVAEALQDRNPEKRLAGEREGMTRVKERSGVINQSLLRFIGSPSVERSMQTGPSAVKRSLSCSAKVFLSRHGSRSRSEGNPQ